MTQRSRAEYHREWRKKNPGKATAYYQRWKEKKIAEIGEEAFKRDAHHRARKSRLRKMYGLTLEEFDRMWEAQGRQCPICGTEDNNGRWEQHAIDHCHETGKVRGILCNQCNRGMGLLKDDPDICQKAASYLIQFKEKSSE